MDEALAFCPTLHAVQIALAVGFHFVSGKLHFDHGFCTQQDATGMSGQDHPDSEVLEGFVQTIERQAYGGDHNPWMDVDDPRVEALRRSPMLGYHPDWERCGSRPGGVRECIWIEAEQRWKSGGFAAVSGTQMCYTSVPARVRPMPPGPSF